MADLRPLVYSRELERNIFPDNSFYKKSVSESGLAADAETVVKPVAGTIPAAKDGQPTSLPMKVEVVTDSQKSYSMTKLIAPPIFIDDESEITTQYSKRREYQLQQAEIINDLAAKKAARIWGPTAATNLVVTTGTGRATSLTGATGSRKAVTKNDFIKVRSLLNRMNIKGGGARYALLTEDALEDLLKIAEFVDYEKLGVESKLKEGIIGKLLGFEIYTRHDEDFNSTGLWYNSSDAKDTDGTVGATDRPANLFWTKRAVCHAEAHAKAIINIDPPGYLGGVMIEAYTRFGADIMRSDQRGVIALLEDTV